MITKITLILLFSTICVSKEIKKSMEEQRGEEINFKNIKGILENDFLDKRAKEKVKVYKQLKQQRVQDDTNRFNYPSERDVWSFFSELWIIKNSSKLKWDTEKPQYGIETTLTMLFEKFGIFEKKVKILIIDSPRLTHIALPSNKGESIFIISLPFIRTMDLTKREISILLLEDYIRDESGYFKNYVADKKFKSLLGENFKNKKFDESFLTETLKKYNDFIYTRGFSFQQQFNVTEKVSNILKSDLSFWNSYLTLLNKVDQLIKTNELYKDYTKMYPSPELQIKWILPDKKVL